MLLCKGTRGAGRNTKNSLTIAKKDLQTLQDQNDSITNSLNTVKDKLVAEENKRKAAQQEVTALQAKLDNANVNKKQKLNESAPLLSSDSIEIALAKAAELDLQKVILF